MQDAITIAAATITVEVLRQTKPIYGELTSEVITSAFKQAYRALEKAGDEMLHEGPPPSVRSL